MIVVQIEDKMSQNIHFSQARQNIFKLSGDKPMQWLTVYPNSKNQPKIRFEKFVKLTYLTDACNSLTRL